MAVRMLIDASHKEETRVAIVSGNRVEDFDFESASKKQLKGNIYLAKVTRVEPSLQAAFVDYGGNRHGFLAFSEIHPDYYQIPVEDREALLAEEREADAEAEDEDEDEAEGQEASAETAAAQEDHKEERGEVESIVSSHEDVADEIIHRPKRLKRRYKIQEVIRRRQILLVQVVKEERGNKGAALTTYLSLAGRYSVFMPNTHHGGGVSRKIGNPGDRRKLKEVLNELDLPDGMGCIIRTAGLSRTKAEIKRDFEYLKRTWDEIREQTITSTAPALIYEEGDLIKRSLRDLYTRDVDEILVEGEEGYKSAKNFVKLLMPSHAKKVQHYKENIPLFHRYQVEGQLDSMYNPVVTLRSGGYIVINPTEALVSIDVNSGRATREHNIEETALKTNQEAAEEISRQLRLRDMAGLIVIDFIDMEDRRNIREVERRLKDCLKHDRARIQVGRISPFGLLEMSRQRLRPGLLEASTRPCPHCEGTGIVRSVESSALHVLRAIEEEGIRARATGLRVYMPTAVAFYLLNNKRHELGNAESRYGFSVSIEVDDTLIAPKFRMERLVAPKEEAEAEGMEGEAPREEAVEAVEPRREPRPEQRAEEPSGEERGGRRRRRRRRRGGRGEGRDEARFEGRYEDREEEDQASHEAELEGAESPGEAEETAPGAAERPREAAEGENERRKRRRRGRRGGRRRGREQETMAEGGYQMSEQPSVLEISGEPAIQPATAPEAEIEPAAAEMPQSVETAEVVTVAQAEAAPAPRSRQRNRRRTREAEIAPETQPETPAESAAEAGEKPRRRRRGKPMAEAEAVAAPIAIELPLPEPAAAAAIEPAAAPAAAQPAALPVAVEADRHLASAPVTVKEVGGESAGEPRKKGWWQRALER
ncbi:MAG: ribonuclease E/G [Sphingomonadales bacterium]|nr:ribonuclease E/G [Sphingomonadales bacterium]